MRDLTVPAFARLTDFFGLWAIEPTAGNALASMLGGLDLAAHVRQGIARPVPVVSTTEMIPGGNDKRVAVIKAVGTLMKGQSSLGGTSTIQLRRDIRNAAADPSVSGILLAIESPGGTIAGTPELAADVKAARRKKPVWSHIDDMGASAAYWVASQADQVFANHPTASVGNVGTIFAVTDVSKRLETEGVKVNVFATGPLKSAGYRGTALTDEQRAMFQGLVDDAQQYFDAAVRSGRGLTAAQMEAVRTGEIFTAAKAKTLGLIDGIRPLDQTIAALLAAR